MLAAPFLVMAALAQAQSGGLPGLLATDRALGNVSARNGLAQAVADAAADDVVFLYAGAPVLSGKVLVETLLRAQRLLDSLSLHWAPMDGWLSHDERLGVTYGRVEVTNGRIETAGRATPPGPSRTGTYIAAWRQVGARWRLAALMLGGVVPPSRTLLPGGIGPVEHSALPAAGPARDLIQADLDFAALAGRATAPEAFRSYAAPDAIMLPGGGAEPRRGPDAIAQGIGAGPASDWVWFPVVGEIAASGDLGYTVGQAVISPRDGGDRIYSKYLTVWRRTPDGRVRFLTDGGNPRPKP